MRDGEALPANRMVGIHFDDKVIIIWAETGRACHDHTANVLHVEKQIDQFEAYWRFGLLRFIQQVSHAQSHCARWIRFPPF